MDMCLTFNNFKKMENNNVDSGIGEVKKAPLYKNKNVMLVAAIVVVLAVYGVYTKKIDLSKVKSSFQSGLTQEQAKTKVEGFIKDNLVPPGTEVSIKSASEENGMYKVVVSVGKQEINSFITRDGKKFFPQAMDIAEVEKKTADQKKESEPKKVPKADKPSVDLYVMSFCPYGNKSEDTLKPVYDLLKNKVNFNFHYIVSVEGDNIQSLHGQKETDQDMREACVLKESGKDKWFSFVSYVNKNCGSDGACWEKGAAAAGLNAAKISSCVASQGKDLMKAAAAEAEKNDASGSPTFLINGVKSEAVYQYGNSEEYKKAICDSFNTAPAECSKTLSSATSTAQGGSCGN